MMYVCVYGSTITVFMHQWKRARAQRRVSWHSKPAAPSYMGCLEFNATLTSSEAIITDAFSNIITVSWV